MMNLQCGVAPISNVTTVKIPEIQPHARDYYSEKLTGLVTECVQFLPADRIRPNDLYQEIQDHVTSHPAKVPGAQMKLSRLTEGEHVRCKRDPNIDWAK